MANNELKHYGVLGMKWGVRKTRGKLEKSNLRKQFDAAKKKKKYAKSEFNDDFDTFFKKSKFGPSGDRRIDNMIKSLEKSEKADLAYKNVKSKRKTAIKLKALEFEKATSRKEKLLYNPATRAKAAKYVVDNNLSVADASKRAKEDALINTAIFLAAYGSLAVVGSKFGFRL